ncbi:MAG: carbohydrate transporter permease [Proteobacteria bacterium]|nr:carbohydrate transporter permease [Pseudomonadota bacterium]
MSAPIDAISRPARSGWLTPRRRKAILARGVLYLLLAIVAIFFAGPLYILLSTSFKTMPEIQSGGLMTLPHEPTVQPWITAWGEACIGITCGGLKGYFGNSMVMTIPAVLISVMIGAINGYALAKWPFPGARFVFAALVAGNFVPFQVVLAPVAVTLRTLGLFGSVEGLILIHVIYGIPITTMLFRNFFLSVPNDLIKAARIDGAGFFWIFFRIVLPLSPSVIVVALILQFTGIWNDFLFAVSFSNPSSAPMTVALNNLVNSNFGVKEYNVHMAATVIAAAPTLILYILLGRYFLRGMTAGAVKG